VSDGIRTHDRLDHDRWSAINKAGGDAAKLDALTDYRTSPLFSDSERAALAFATELTEVARERCRTPALA
jgi:alkylhydroperoxidase family enzyme